MESQIVIGPNASLSSGQALFFMFGISLVGLSIAISFAVLGFWMILPVAGLELAALGAALAVSVRRNAYREVVTVSASDVRVAFGRVGEGVKHEVSFPRMWTRVELCPGANALAHNELRLAYGAQRIALGRCLTDDERMALAVRLKAVVSGRPSGVKTVPPLASVS